MKKIRNWLLLLISILLFFGGVSTFLFGWVVPTTASFSVPRKWNRIPLRQSKNIVHGYFGQPSFVGEPTFDQWANGSKGKMYFLRIYYASDTVAVRYSIHYQFSNNFASRDYLLDSFSIRE